MNMTKNYTNFGGHLEINAILMHFYSSFALATSGYELSLSKYLLKNKKSCCINMNQICLKSSHIVGHLEFEVILGHFRSFFGLTPPCNRFVI